MGRSGAIEDEADGTRARSRLGDLSRAMLLVGFLVGCGGDSTGLSLPDVNGTWTVTYATLSGTHEGDEVLCNASPAVLEMVQSEDTFAGDQVNESDIACYINGAPFFGRGGLGYTVTDGLVSPSSVTFRLGPSSDIRFSGAIEDDSMTGTVEWIEDVGPFAVTLTGDFTAERG